MRRAELRPAPTHALTHPPTHHLCSYFRPCFTPNPHLTTQCHCSSSQAFEAKVRQAALQAAKSDVAAASTAAKAATIAMEQSKLADAVQAMERQAKCAEQEAAAAAEKQRAEEELRARMGKARDLAHYMKNAALKHTLEAQAVSLKGLQEMLERQNDPQNELAIQFRLSSLQLRLEDKETKLQASLAAQEVLEERFKDAHKRTLDAENKATKLKKDLAESKKMLEALVK